uniref:NFX1-type zinc finger-containing protein 1 n=1 Tax=Pogona vitticeps TaxID=103695 RepID=A0A6J0UWU2_9SAUR
MEGRGHRGGGGGGGGGRGGSPLPHHPHQQRGRGSGRGQPQRGPNHGREGPERPRRGAFRLQGHPGMEGRVEPRQERNAGSGRVVIPDGGQDGRRRSQDRARRLEREPGAEAGHRRGFLRLGENRGHSCQWGPGRGGDAQKPPARPPQRIGPAFLEGLLEKEPSEVAITLASSTGLKEALSQTAMGPRFLQLLCQVLRRACCSRMDRKSIQQVLGLVKESSFLQICLPRYVTAMLTEAVPAMRHQFPEHMGNILALVQELVSIFPASSIRQVTLLMSLLPASVNALRASGVDFPEETEKTLENLQGYIQHLQERRREGTLRVDSHTLVPASPGERGEDGEEEGEDYRTLSIFPTYEEVHQEKKPLLRPNLVAQPYESPAVYLDTHFRLLREDFVRPLREGILQLLLRSEDQGLRRLKFDDIRVYFDTRILSPLCSVNGIEYKVQFDTKPLKFVRWENSKRLLYGSLVCLSKDHFETFLFATIAQREGQDLRKGLVHLAFSERSRPLLAEVQPTDAFLMVETTAYFEAYRHVLQALQEMRHQEVPFQKYIVRCEAQVTEPEYLARGGGGGYDLSCLLQKPGPRQRQEEGAAAPEPLRGLGRSPKIDILDPQQWPTEEALGLDESQLQALRLALTKELAIIQGPPGTGKTYVGLKVMEVLLNNPALRGRSPILVVCYTNHALDQFLEGIHTFLTTGIVRVGGRSNSESLKQFTLRELRNKRDIRKWLPGHLRQAYANVSGEMREAQVSLEQWGAQLECSLRGILHERHLKSHVADGHWESLVRGCAREWMNPKDSLILEWLGLSASSFGQSDPDGDEASPADSQEEEEEAALLQIAGEAELIEAERLLDQDEEGRARSRRRLRDWERAQLDDLFLAMTLADKEGGEEEEENPDSPHWEFQRHQKKAMKQRMKAELQKRQAMTEAEASDVRDVWHLDRGSRWQLYRYWLQKYQAEIRRRILEHEEVYQGAADRLAELRLQEDLLILQEAQVVGMTTTGAARYRQVLQQVAPQVVVVEEAAEVLEAHTVTTLSSACQHLILIGDHQQLRPSANVFDLARNFNLEVSLFERMVKVGLPFVRLNFQHRMRPEIARLLTPHIYQDLENHPSVLQYENIKGVSSNLFFVEHSCLEQEIQEGKSHQNLHEAQFVVELCRYLLHQGYAPSQITILTTYTGQLYCLRKLLPAKTFQGVKVHVVDKYQGEENDLILLSLVRSNAEGRVGFLQIPNRVCVALSRARKGLYCIGNMAMLGKVPLWSKILHVLRGKGQVGPALRLSCQNHPETKTDVAQPKDFQKVPEGGCSRPCEARLSCGHVCPRACHPYDPEHKEMQCLKPCQKVLCPEGHRCPRQCFKPCGKCQVKVPKTLPTCGHQQEVPCSVPAEAFCCQEPCEKALRCGHRCRQTCGQECTRRCQETVQAALPCGHRQKVPCATAADLRDGRPVPCWEKCPGALECGHPCPGSCHACFGGRFHKLCRSPCERLLICSHKCQQPCTSDCPPCPLPCQNRCVHSRCLKTCGEACTPCTEPCEWRCRHYRCSRLCSEPCDRPRCDRPCPERLPCGHPCAGICGEPCPKKCLVCDHEELTQIFFGFEDEPGARFVQLEDCGHVFEAQGLDCYMEDGEDDDDGAAIRLKVCPSCQTPIRKNLRYGTLVKKRLSEVEAVKEKIRGHPAEIAARAQGLKAELKGKAGLRASLLEEYLQLLQRLGEPSLSLQSLALTEHLMGFYGRLAELEGALKKVAPAEMAGPRARMAEVAGWLKRPRLSFTSQELSELQSEFQRLTYLVDLLARCKAAGGNRGASTEELISTARKLLEGPGRFTPEEEELVKAKMEALKAVLPPASGLGISEEERKQIVAAITPNTRGHWFKCPNGHVYVIGECGGAMQKSRCPECQETIGGENHALDPSNRLAPEMDGATHAAWSDAANHLLEAARLQWRF